MTKDQKELFVAIAQSGITCGLEHHFEWLVNWIRSLGMWAKHEEIDDKELAAYECYAALYSESAPGYNPTVDDIIEMVNKFYSRPKCGRGN